MNLADAITASCRPVSPVPDVVVSGITADSRRVKPGDLFVSMLGGRQDPQPFIDQALAAGAAAVVVGDPTFLRDGQPILAIDHRDFVGQISLLARAVLGDPSRDLTIVGITGTNGKTTCAYLLQQCLTGLGQNCAYLGTLGLLINGSLTELANTTPFPVELWTLVAQVRDAGCTHLAMEVSSHALEQRRMEGVRLTLGAFTNFSQDHLDFHGTLDAYEAAKLKLFTHLGPTYEPEFRAVINGADPVGAKWAAQLGSGTVDANSPLTIREVRATKIRGSIGEHAFAAPVGGTFNVENLQVVAGCLLALGYGEPDIARVLDHVRPVPGRFEALAAADGPEVIVDYAHTPDALEKVLRSARALDPKRLTVVFGCGGDRDRTKRPLMASIASEWADRVILTSDNPRTEDPAAILREVAQGIEPSTDATEIVDRPAAIQHAVTEALPGEIVVIAGKGHEKTQTIQHEKIPMDDVELARAALAQWSRP